MLWRARPVLLALAVATVGVGVLDVLRPAPPPTVDVVVVARAVRAGTALEGADLTVRTVPVAVAPDGVPARTDAAVGRVAAVDLTRGTPLVPGVLVGAGAAGPPGTVVATVRLADDAAAALLGPGMRVDLIAAAPDDGDGRVVASRALVLPTPPARAAEPDMSAFGAGPTTASPVLVAVTPDEARALVGASATALLSAVVVP